MVQFTASKTKDDKHIWLLFIQPMYKILAPALPPLGAILFNLHKLLFDDQFFCYTLGSHNSILLPSASII